MGSDQSTVSSLEDLRIPSSLQSDEDKIKALSKLKEDIKTKRSGCLEVLTKEIEYQKLVAVRIIDFSENERLIVCTLELLNAIGNVGVTVVEESPNFGKDFFVEHSGSRVVSSGLFSTIPDASLLIIQIILKLSKFPTSIDFLGKSNSCCTNRRIRSSNRQVQGVHSNGKEGRAKLHIPHANDNRNPPQLLLLRTGKDL